MFFAASQADCVALLCVLESIVAKDFFTAIAHIYIVVTILTMILCLFSLPSSTNLNFDVGFLLCSQVVQKFFPVLFKKRAQAPAADEFCVNVSFLIRSA